MTHDPATRSGLAPGEPPGAADPPEVAHEPTGVLPPDPEAYDSARAVQARARGLSAPYIPGGLDPHPEVARREERRDLWLLLAMVLTIVLAGFVLGYLAMLLGLPT